MSKTDGLFTIDKQKYEGSFGFAMFNIKKINKHLCLSKLLKQPETKRYVYKININKQKLTAWFTRPI